MVMEIAEVPAAELPIGELRDQLRLGTGFADDMLVQPLLEASLRSALSLVETRCGRAVLERAFKWQLPTRTLPAILPLAGVSAVVSVEVLEADGTAEMVDRANWALVPDDTFPELIGRLPRVTQGGSVRVVFRAGFGAWSDVPADLRQAVLRLAVRFYEDRGESGSLPSVVSGLLAPWRRMRIGGAA